jgi:hypothetical protein
VVQAAEQGTHARISLRMERFDRREFEPADGGKKNTSAGTLIPGATYTLQTRTASARSEPITFTAPLTGVRDLGTLTLESPPAGKRPAAPATIGKAFIYKPTAVDPDGDPLLFDLVRAPAGMTCDPQTGAVYWVPGPTQVGTHTVALRVSDPYGGSSIQAWPITVPDPAKDPPAKPNQP